MLQITPQMRIFVAVQPVDFRNGIDGLAIVKLDVLRGFKTLKMCVAYDTAAGRIETVPATAPGSSSTHC